MFENYVTQYQSLVVTVCLAMTKNYFDAEDLAQETFLSAYRSFSRFDGKNPKAWFTAIAVNKCRDFLRSPVYRNRSLSDEDMELLTDGSATPEECVEKKSSDSLVQHLCGRLKEPYRSVAKGYFCNGKKLSEMAKETGQSLRTLETRLYRSKKLLKTLWKEEQENEVHSQLERPSDTADAS